MGSGERMRRLPQQSTLDGGLRGAAPPLRRLSAVEPRHLAPLASPPHSPRQKRIIPQPSVSHTQTTAPLHPTPTISVSSAPDEESGDSPPRTNSPDERRSFIQSEEPSSVFASTDVTPTEPAVVFAGAVLIEATSDSSEDDVDKIEGISSHTEVPDTCEDVASDIDQNANTKANDKQENVKEEHKSICKSEKTYSATDIPKSDNEVDAVGNVTRIIVSQKSVDMHSPPHSIVSERDNSQRSTIERVRLPIAPLATCEDIVEDENIDKMLVVARKVSLDSKAVSADVKIMSRGNERTESDIVKGASKSADSKISDRKQRNDICPWEDE